MFSFPGFCKDSCCRILQEFQTFHRAFGATKELRIAIAQTREDKSTDKLPSILVSQDTVELWQRFVNDKMIFL